MLVHLLDEVASGFRRTKITESPLKNIFEMKRSLLTGFTFFLPLPVRGISVHISFTLENSVKMTRKIWYYIWMYIPELHWRSKMFANTYLSRTMLQWRSKALTRPSNFLLLRQLMRTCVLFFTDCVSTDNGPVLNSSSSWRANSSGVNSDFGLFNALNEKRRKKKFNENQTWFTRREKRWFVSY